MQPSTEADPMLDASRWWDSLFYVEKTHALLDIGEPQTYYKEKFRDLPEHIQQKIVEHLRQLDIGEYYYRGGWKPGDYAIYSDFGLRSMFIVEVLPWPESIVEQIEEMPFTGEIVWRDSTERREGTVRAKIVDTTLVDWESPGELSPWRQVDTVHHYNYTNLYHNVYDLVRQEAAYIYPSVMEKNLRGLQAHPGWEVLKKYGLVSVEDEEKAKEKARMTLWERAMNLLQKHNLRDKATWEEAAFIQSMLPMETDAEIRNQIRKDLMTYPMFDAIAMWVQPVKGALSEYEPAVFGVAKAMIEKYEQQYKLSTVEKLEYLPQEGTCYQDAWRFIIKEQEGTLVHGSVWVEGRDWREIEKGQAAGKRINHAWVETETGYIWEPEKKEFFLKSDWEYQLSPIETARYTPEEAAIMAARTRNFGPWSKEERSQFIGQKQEFLPSVTSDYWNVHLEHNALRSPPSGGGPDTDAGAFLAWYLEAAGDIISELDKGEYADPAYITEKFNRIRDHLNERDWRDRLGDREEEALEDIRDNIANMPVDKPTLKTLKAVLLNIAYRRPKAIAGELGTLRQQLNEVLSIKETPSGVSPQPLGEDIFPLNITEELYEKVWKPAGWQLLIIGPTATWRQDWGPWEAVRDIVQNCLDETESYESGYDNNGLWIADQGKGVAISDFLLGPPKLKPDWARGKFGEGMKIACLAMVRARYPVHVETQTQEMWMVFYEQPIGAGSTAETLAALWRPQNGKSRWGTKFQFIGYRGYDFKYRFTINLPQNNIIWRTPSWIDEPMTRWNTIIDFPFPPEPPESPGWFESERISGSRIFARDIYFKTISSPYSYNLWSFAMAPDRHAPANEEDMWIDMGRTWSCVAHVDLLEIFFQMVTRPPKLETDESYNLSMDLVKLGKMPDGTRYFDIINENKDAWQQAFLNVNGENAVLRTSDRWDNTVRHLGYEPVSVSYWTENALKEILKTDRNLIDESQDRLRDIAIVPDKDLTARQLVHLKLAREIAKWVGGRRKVSGVWAAVIPPASDRVRTAGVYGTTTREIFIDVPQLENARDTVDTDIHELAHHRSDGAEDGTEEHLRWVTNLAGAVVQATANKQFDDIIADPWFSW